MVLSKYEDLYILKHLQVFLAPNSVLDTIQKGSFYFIRLKNTNKTNRNRGKKNRTGLGKDQRW